jgi:hypothetical protein
VAKIWGWSMKTVAKTVLKAVPTKAVPPKRVTKPTNSDHVAGLVESVQSILVLLRGVGPVLVGSAPDQAAVTDLLAGLKDPVPKED